MRLPRLTGSLCALASVALLATGCGASTSTPVAAQASAELAPADAMAYVTIVSDETSAQWERAGRLLDLVPGGRDKLLAELRDELAQEGFVWEEDVAPALGPEVVVVVTAGRKPIVLTQPEDDAKLDALLAKADKGFKKAAISGWTALAESQTDLDTYRAALDGGTLSTQTRFTTTFATLPEDALARVWVDASSAMKELGDIAGQAGTDLDIGFESLAAAISAEDDGLLVSLGIRTPDSGGGYEPKLFAQVPADAVAAISFGGTQGTFDKLRDSVDLDKAAKEIEEATGVSLDNLFDAFSGEGVLYLREGESIPEVTLVIAPPDRDETWKTVTKLADVLAEQIGGTVATGTEGGAEVRRLEIGDDMTVTFAKAGDDKVVVSTAAGATTSFGAASAKLVDGEAFKRAAAAVELGDKTSGFVYVDIDGLIPFIEGFAGADQIPSEARDALGAIDAFILQSRNDGDVTVARGFVRVNNP